MAVFLATLSPLLVMFMCIVAGFVLKKSNILPADTEVVLSRLEKYLFLPAMNFASFSTYCTVSSLKANFSFIPYCLLSVFLAIIIATPLSKAFERNDDYKRNIYKYSLIYANSGFMGNAIAPAILGGSEHLYKYLLFALPITVTVYVWGVNLLTPPKYRSKNLIKNIFNAPIVGLLLGAVVGISGLGQHMPSFITTAVSYFQNCMGPVAMLLTGFVIGGYSFKSLLSNKKIYIVSLFRLILIPAVLATALYVAGASKYILSLLLIATATPLGLNTVVFPATYGSDTKLGASMAMISHTLCVITIPLMFMLLDMLVKG
ncbi:MAG: hypothetical protein E7635_03305 [Ruminococcaceae bacterium]|nr:hypothetical protein [Oscillospiraceae bacterium]